MDGWTVDAPTSINILCPKTCANLYKNLCRTCIFLYLLVRHRNMEPAWEKVNGLKFQLKQRTISQHGRKLTGANLRWLNTISQPNGGTRKITQGKFHLSTYKVPTGRTLPCENQRDRFVLFFHKKDMFYIGGGCICADAPPLGYALPPKIVRGQWFFFSTGSPQRCSPQYCHHSC